MRRQRRDGARRRHGPSPSGHRARAGHWDVVIADVGLDAEAGGSLTRVVSNASVVRLHLGDRVRDGLGGLPDRDRDDVERGAAAGLLAGQMPAEARQRLEKCEAALHARFELRPRLNGHRVAVDAKLDVRVFIEVDQEWSHNAASMRLANGVVLKKSAKAASGQSAPLLGQAANGFRERTVAAPLRPYFASVWIHRAADTPRRSAIVPDGCADLVFANGMLRVAGPDRRVKIELPRPGRTVIGLRFQPGAAAPWLQTSAAQLVAVTCPLESFWGSEARRLGDWLSEAPSAEDTVQRLEMALARRVVDIEPPDETPAAIFRYLASRTSGTPSVMRHLTQHLGFSERTIRRQCSEAFGFGPKAVDRILRFQRFLALVRRAPSADIAGLAASTGYSDQAHLTREARRLAGVTPTTARAQLLSRRSD
jgi:AraC-like DNA-binding protein